VSVSAALVKLAKAARMSAEAQKLYLEAAEELSHAAEAPTPPPPVTNDFDVARAKRALRKAGARVR
jgi:hypothetical protein